MNHREYILLKSEENELLHILDGLPDERWIEKLSFEGRLEDVRESLEGVTPPVAPKKAVLTFRGKPVRGSEAITADFASKATSYFNNAVTAIAASLNERLGYMGKIPDKQANQLLITGTAQGSFGFEYEVPTPTESNNEINSSVALEKLIDIFQVGAEGDDEKLSELIDEIHPRAAKSVAELLDFSAREKAYCGLGMNDHRYQFSNLESLEKAAKRVKSDNISKGEHTFNGELVGYLPNSREFEFKKEDSSEVIKGRISIEIDEPEKLSPYLERPVCIDLSFIQIGQSRPRYTLKTLSDLEVL